MLFSQKSATQYTTCCFEGIVSADKEKSKLEQNKTMAKKIRELIQYLLEAGFYEIKGTGKGSHRKYTHALYPGAVTISGKAGEDSKKYQEKQVLQAIEEVKK